MVSSIWIWTTIAVLALFSFLKQNLKKSNNRKLPPSPSGLPIIGHLHLLGKNPHHNLHNLARKHGPIMHLKFGFVDTIIVSSPHAAEQFLKTHDQIFAGRPPNEVAKYVLYEQRNLTFAQYGPYWRTMRKICTLQLLNSNKINSFQSMRTRELGHLLKSLKEAAYACVTVDLSAAVSSLNTDMSCLMIFGNKFSDADFHKRGFRSVIQEVTKLTMSPGLGEFFPYVGKLDLQGITRRLKELGKIFDDFLEKIVQEHEEQEGQFNDLTSTLLAEMKSGTFDFPFDRRHVKGVMFDMLVASMDTSATVVEWALSELLKHPEVMKKVQDELEEKVGMNRMVEESDLDNLSYLEMVVKEVLRLHSVVPLIPHEALEDCMVDGLHIPKKSRILINTWAIGRDPNAWSDAESFIPERFLERNINPRGQNFELIPFGSGRRGCPGIQLGLTVVKLLLAQLMHCFEWKLPENMQPSELDMTEEFGLVVSRAIHLVAIPTYRLQI